MKTESDHHKTAAKIIRFNVILNGLIDCHKCQLSMLFCALPKIALALQGRSLES